MLAVQLARSSVRLDGSAVHGCVLLGDATCSFTQRRRTPLITKQRSVASTTDLSSQGPPTSENRGQMRLGRPVPFGSRYGAYYRSHGVTSAEIAMASWYKSSASGYNGNCVEVSHLGDGRVAVGDTKDTASGPVLIFTRP